MDTISANCITVAQLKKLLADWPEVDGDGEPTQVWIETGEMLSSPAVMACPLNRRGNAADLIISS